MNILVTGGASGLGRAITEKLAATSGNRVYFTYNKSQAACSEIENRFSNTKGIKCDFLSLSEMQNILLQLTEINPDVLVNNAFAGSIGKQHFHKGGIQRFENDFTTNVLPVIKITQETITIFRKKKFGKIITILTSAIINRPPTGWSEYVAGKAYLHALSKSWAVENAAFNITSNCVSPAFMQSALTGDTDERIIEEMQDKHPLKKLLNPLEVAETVSYLVGCPQQINGANVIINAASDLL